MRLPTAKGRAIRRTGPAKTLPKLCWAAMPMPMTTPAMAPQGNKWPTEIDSMESMRSTATA
jgi:hypothetical protein